MAIVNDTNFVTIQGWMRTKLNLKGNELLAYAVIYGFSQTGGARFTGSRKYLAEWCGCSLATIDRTLDSLVGKGLITKTAYVTPHGYRAIEYAAVPVDSATPASPTDENPTQSQTPDDEPQPPVAEPRTTKQQDKPDAVKEIVDHLNARLGTHYKPTTPATRKLLKARLNEGFTVEEIKTVIDKKAAEWLGNASMAQYLRPETLFGNKFESYLNARTATRTNTYSNVRSNAYSNAYSDPSATAYARANGYATRTPIDDEGHLAECTRENGWF